MFPFLPEDATDKTVEWSSSDPEIATVDEDGIITAVKGGTVIITARAENATASCTVTVFRKCYPGAVDLGVICVRDDGSGHRYKIFWAECNLGASTPDGNGVYFSWAETMTKTDFSWSNYAWAQGDMVTKYCPDDKPEYWGGIGNPDNKYVLDPEDDAAHLLLGGGWRTPLFGEWLALIEQCDWTWTTTSNGVNGYKVTSKTNGNSIFLPAAGLSGDAVNYRGWYWSSLVSNFTPCDAWYCDFDATIITSLQLGRNYGLSIRPVAE